MTDNRTTELSNRREVTTLLEEFLCGYQNILLSRGINASEAVRKQNELIDEYAERIEQAIAATLGNGEHEKLLLEIDSLKFQLAMKRDEMDRFRDNMNEMINDEVREITATLVSERHAYEQRITGDGSDWGKIMRSAYDDLMANACESCTPEQMEQLTDYICAELGSGTCRNQWQWNSGFCCSECFYTVPFVGKFVGKAFRYCPNCRKAVSA